MSNKKLTKVLIVQRFQRVNDAIRRTMDLLYPEIADQINYINHPSECEEFEKTDQRLYIITGGWFDGRMNCMEAIQYYNKLSNDIHIYLYSLISKEYDQFIREYCKGKVDKEPYKSEEELCKVINELIG